MTDCERKFNSVSRAALLIIVLLVKPTGLLGKKISEKV